MIQMPPDKQRSGPRGADKLRKSVELQQNLMISLTEHMLRGPFPSSNITPDIFIFTPCKLKMAALIRIQTLDLESVMASQTTRPFGLIKY